MKLRIAVVVLVAALVAGAMADQVVQNVQQALKDQGFYYGEVTGNKDADTAAAIRRYQIRNGLQITGDLNDETLKSLGVESSGGRAVVKAAPTALPDTSDLKAPLKTEPEPEQTQAPTNPLTGQPFPEPSRAQDRQPRDESLVPAHPAENFAGTPYEIAPPDVQRNVVASAQNILARRGLYRGPVDGAAYDAPPQEPVRRSRVSSTAICHSASISSSGR